MAAILSLEYRIRLFYEKYAPSFLVNDGIRGVVAWTHNHGEDALNERLKKKYGATLDDVAPKPAQTQLPKDTNPNGNLNNDHYWELMKQALFDFYTKHDPFKDEKEIENVLQWTKKHGINDLNKRLLDKYKETIAVTLKQPDISPLRAKDVPINATPTIEIATKTMNTPPPSSFSNSNQLQADTQQKTEDAQSNAKAKVPPALPERKKNGSALTLVTENGSGSSSDVLANQQFAGNAVNELDGAYQEREMNRKLVIYFQKYDPEKSKKDIDFLASYAVKHGIEKINDQLKLNFGVGLDDVDSATDSKDETDLLAAAAKPSKPKVQESMSKTHATGLHVVRSPEEELQARKDEIAKKLRIFYRKHDPTKLDPANIEQFNKVLTYGLEKGLVKLNGALRDKYKEDLDDIPKAQLRQSLTPFFQKNQPDFRAELQHQLAEEAVNFALRHGQDALDEKLRMEYGEDTTGKLGEL